MPILAPTVKADTESLMRSIQDARERLEIADGEVVLDLSSMVRLDPMAVNELKGLADLADGKAVKIVLRGISVDGYKVLKLVNLAHRFSFAN